MTKTVFIIGHMITAQKNNYSDRQFQSCGFETFRRRITDLLSVQGDDPFDVDDDTLFQFYRNGENETYVLAAFGHEN